MTQATVLTVLGCSSSLTLALMMSEPAIAAPTPQAVPQIDVAEQTTLVQVSETCPRAAVSGYTSDDSLVDALGCACALCNPNREQASTPPIQN